MKRIFILTAATAVLALTAFAGSAPPFQHEVILIATVQDWNAPEEFYPATIWACTRSSGAPACPIYENTAQAIADLMNAGFRVDPNLSTTIRAGIAFVK